MFKAPSGETPRSLETLAISQAQIDEAITLDIYRLECLPEGKEDPSKLDALCDQALVKYLRDRFSVDSTKIQKRNRTYIVTLSPKQEARLSVDEVYSALDQEKKTAQLTISFSLSIDGIQKHEYDRVVLTASTACVQSILEKLHERDAERERQEQASQRQLERLLPSAIAFARQHPFEKLNKQACTPIAEFIETVLGGELSPEETLQMIRRDDAEPAWEFIRYRDGEVWDIRQFSEKLAT